jgi:excisionase family DNA binding protein
LLRQEDMLSTGEAAQRFHVSSGTVRNWIEKGYIEAVHFPSGQRRVPRSEVERLCRAMFEFPHPDGVEEEPVRHRPRQPLEPGDWGVAI